MVGKVSKMRTGPRITIQEPTANIAIINFRRASWDPVTFRDHALEKVYLSDSDHNDVVVIGKVTLGTGDGQRVEEGFAMSLLFNDDGLIRKFEAWFVSDMQSR